ncbi:AbfB domain-containing protein [Cyanobacterium aponinum]|uniref:AbfB domain-containing protein n=1 Tax=Cyanobacterium aponinum TaxID=379064 RepID=UPI0026C7272D
MKNKTNYFSFLGLNFFILILLSITGKSLANNKQRQLLKSGNVISLRSTNYPDRYIRHRNYLGQLTKVITELDMNESLFIPNPRFASRCLLYWQLPTLDDFQKH